MHIYLDNCCYNRPYDDQSQLRISLEAQAKLQIQSLIKNESIDLVSSYVLLYENSKNPNAPNKKTILRFVTEYTDIYVDIDRSSEIKRLAEGIVATGVKTVDAEHVACAILAGCEYFLTTDDRLLKYKTGQIKIMDPTEFIRNWEVQE